MKQADVYEYLLWLFGFRRRYRVSGLSMAPLLTGNEEVLITNKTSKIKKGDIVIARHPFLSISLAKRVHSVSQDKKFDLRGFNVEESSDSRTLGLFDQKNIVGKITSVIS